MSQRMMIMIGAAVLVLALGVGGFLVWRSRATAPAPLSSGQSASTQPAPSGVEGTVPVSEGEAATSVSRGCAQRESAEACSDAEEYAAAVAAKDAARCMDIGDVLARDLCVGAAAEAAADSSQCDRITADGIRTRCVERAATAAARSQGSVAPCAALAAAAQISCRAAAYATGSGPEACDPFGDFASECRASFGEPPAATGAVPPETLPESGDEDGDELTNGRERDLGTDPRNRDTDGDGYADGEEVKNGYNPLGPGKLQTTTP